MAENKELSLEECLAVIDQSSDSSDDDGGVFTQAFSPQPEPTVEEPEPTVEEPELHPESPESVSGESRKRRGSGSDESGKKKSKCLNLGNFGFFIV